MPMGGLIPYGPQAPAKPAAPSPATPAIPATPNVAPATPAQPSFGQRPPMASAPQAPVMAGPQGPQFDLAQLIARFPQLQFLLNRFGPTTPTAPQPPVGGSLFGF